MEEEKDIVQFGLESLEGNLMGIAITIAIGICFNQMREAVILLLLLFPLRKNAGGYHAATKRRCMFMSAGMMTMAFSLFAVHFRAIEVYIVCTVVAGCVIYFFAPVDNPAKRLDVVERQVYCKRTRKILMGDVVFFALAIVFKWEIMTRSICMTVFIVAISLLIGIFIK